MLHKARGGLGATLRRTAAIAGVLVTLSPPLFSISPAAAASTHAASDAAYSLAAAASTHAASDAAYSLAEAAWIASAQVTTPGTAYGAIAQAPAPYGIPMDSYTGAVCVLPDRSNGAIPGLVAAGPAFYKNALAWLNWYVDNLDWPDPAGLHGSISDFVVTPSTSAQSYAGPGCTPSTTPYYDSSDGYASTFLVAVRAFVEADPSAGEPWVGAHSHVLGAIASVILATVQPNGLIGAKPSYPAQYLEDNVGDVEGMAAMAWLQADVLNQSYGARWWGAQVSSLQAAVETYLWVPCSTQGLYCWASDQVDNDGSDNSVWTNWGPGAYQQAFAIDEGGLSPARDTALWRGLNRYYPDWTTSCLPNPGSVYVCTTNSAMAQAALVVGDDAGAQAWLDGSQATWAAKGRPWPWTVSDAGTRALVAACLAGSAPDQACGPG